MKPRRIFVIGALVLFVCTMPSYAQWSTDPMLNNAICTAANSQYYPTIASDGAGGAIMAWEDSRSGYSDIYAQRINASGVVQWTVDGVAICTAMDRQQNPGIISDGAGGAIITWYDSRSGTADIYAQRINASGVVAWTANGVAICTATNTQYIPTIVSDGAGGAIMTWVDSRSGDRNRDIYAQRINASGAVQWATDGVAICTATRSQWKPTIVSDGTGGAIMTWYDYRNSTSPFYDNNSDIYAQRINALGEVQWTTGGVAICTEIDSQDLPTIASDGAGGAIMTWQDGRGWYSDIYAQRINASGEVQWTTGGVAVCAATNDQGGPIIGSDGAGGAIIMWHDYRSDGYNPDIYAQRINASGVVQWTADGVAICAATDNQEVPISVSDGAGGAIITWHDYRSGNSDIYAQRVRSNGTLGGNQPPVANAGADQETCDGKAVAIGANPAATGDAPPYTYGWSPAATLDDHTAANPNAIPAATTIYTLTVTDANGLTDTDEMTVTVKGTCKPVSFLANKVTLKSTKQITPAGDIHSNGILTVEKGDPSVYNSNLTAVGKITIQKDNTINGDVASPLANSNAGTINGTITVGPVASEPLPSKSYSAGGLNRTVPSGGSLVLAPGSYNLVTLNSGGTLRLTSGDYFFNELRYPGSEAVIEFDLSSGNAANVNLVSNFQFGKEAAIRLLPNGETDSELVTFFTLQSTAVSMGKEAYFLGTLNAPNALVTLVKNSQLRGSICAKEILVDKDCLFLHHDSPGSLPGPGNLPKPSFEEDGQQETSNQQPVTSYQLEQNFPNPFNPVTTIQFSVPRASHVRLKVYNTSGAEVATLVDQQIAPGTYKVNWDASRMASGFYLYRLEVEGFAQTKKLLLMK